MRSETTTLPDALAAATEHQPRARLALGAALAAGPAHAYLFRGPRGTGKRAAARAFAAEILATGAADPFPPEALAAVLMAEGPEEEVAAAARLSGGDVERARFLLSEPGRRLRADAEALARAASDPEGGGAPWKALLDAAEAEGSESEQTTRARLEDVDAGRPRSGREISEEA